ncbi:hypothetical protein TNCV_291791 [Trichonephila clavipes]|nr:hypothetical protein TNCV_291791 [Trichonephila clavipes]
MCDDGSNQEISHDKTGREDVPQSTKRSIEAERRRGEGKNAGRKAGRPKAVNQRREHCNALILIHSPSLSLSVAGHMAREASLHPIS